MQAQPTEDPQSDGNKGGKLYDQPLLISPQTEDDHQRQDSPVDPVHIDVPWIVMQRETAPILPLLPLSRKLPPRLASQVRSVVHYKPLSTLVVL